MDNDTFRGERRTSAALETYEWDQTWIEHTEDLTARRVLYIGDSISIPTRAKLNGIFGEKLRFDGYASSKAADHPYYTESVRLFAAQQAAPYSAVLFNNGLHGWHLDDEEAYPRCYERLVLSLRAVFPATAFFLLATTPTADPDNDARVRLRNRAAAQTAEKYGLGTVDLYHAAPQLPAYLSDDGVHFTDEGYRRLADAAAKAINAFFSIG